MCNICRGACVYVRSSGLKNECMHVCLHRTCEHCTKCTAQRWKKKEKTGFISTRQQWVFKDVRPLVLGYFLCLCISTTTLLERSKSIAVETKKLVTLRLLTVRHLSAEMPKEKEKRKGKKARWGHEEEEECIYMRRRQAAHAGLYS